MRQVSLWERGLRALCQQLFDAFSHGCQTEVFRAQFFHGNPQQFGCIVHGMGQAAVCHRTVEETIYGVYQKSGIQVSVGQGKQKIPCGLLPVRFTSLTSRATPSSLLSKQSENPPGRSSVPLAGSFPLRHVSSSCRSFRMTATVAALGLK